MSTLLITIILLTVFQPTLKTSYIFFVPPDCPGRISDSSSKSTTMNIKLSVPTVKTHWIS